MRKRTKPRRPSPDEIARHLGYPVTPRWITATEQVKGTLWMSLYRLADATDEGVVELLRSGRFLGLTGVGKKGIALLRELYADSLSAPGAPPQSDEIRQALEVLKRHGYRVSSPRVVAPKYPPFVPIRYRDQTQEPVSDWRLAPSSTDAEWRARYDSEKKDFHFRQYLNGMSDESLQVVYDTQRRANSNRGMELTLEAARDRGVQISVPGVE